MSKPLQALLKGCIKGDSRAQRELYERLAPKMLAVCYRYARTEAEAEDILQEGFVKVFVNINKYQDRGSLEGWIKRIMINCAIDHLRKEKAYAHQASLNEVIVGDEAADALDNLALEDLFALIQRLPDGYRMVFNLYAIEGYNHAEIAQQLHISESTSRSQYTRARAMLKTKIRELYLEKHTLRDAI